MSAVVPPELVTAAGKPVHREGQHVRALRIADDQRLSSYANVARKPQDAVEIHSATPDGVRAVQK